MDDILALYTPRVLMAALLQVPAPSLFFRNRLVTQSDKFHDTEYIEMDVEKGGATVAAYVSRTADPTVVEKRPYENIIHAIPYVYENIPYTPKDVEVRRPGQTIYDKGAKKRLMAKVAEWLQILVQRIQRLEELQCAEALQTGKVNVSGENVNYTVDYRRETTHTYTLTGGDAWDQGTSTKIKNLEDAAALPRTAGASTTTDVYMGVDAAGLFLADTQVKEELDNRRFESSSISPEQFEMQKATRLGTLNRIGLNVTIWSYQAQYKDSAGAQQYYLDPDNVCLASTFAQWNFNYGRIDNFLSDMEGRWFSQNQIEPKGKKGEISIETSPLTGMREPDSTVAITTK